MFLRKIREQEQGGRGALNCLAGECYLPKNKVWGVATRRSATTNTPPKKKFRRVDTDLICCSI